VTRYPAVGQDGSIRGEEPHETRCRTPPGRRSSGDQCAGELTHVHLAPSAAIRPHRWAVRRVADGKSLDHPRAKTPTMPTTRKFSEKRRRIIVAALGCGASRRTAAQLAGVSHRTLGRWIELGARSSPGGRWREFADAVAAAEVHPRLLHPRDPGCQPAVGVSSAT
jgi:hypothetical protein